jgi:hypothetical protein
MMRKDQIAACAPICEAHFRCQAISALARACRRLAIGLRAAAWLFGLSGAIGAAPLLAQTTVRFGDVVRVAGADLRMLSGSPLDHLTVLACVHAACQPIPFQIDERDPTGNWVLDQGPEPNANQASGVLQDNDLLLFMAADAGERAGVTHEVASAGVSPSPAHLFREGEGGGESERMKRVRGASGYPSPRPSPTLRKRAGEGEAAEIAISDPLEHTTRWAYVVRHHGIAPRSNVSYVDYDPVNDRVQGERVSLGFRNGVPDYLTLDGSAGPTGPNLLDRLKVRATATFLWGLLRFSRDESDLTTQFVAWRRGPIRVIRRQRQWVRIGWGIRSPTFGSYTYFYRDFAELPVSLRLNFPPRYFFGDIAVETVLDFRDLSGWSVLVPSLHGAIPIDGVMTPQKQALNQLPDSWFALLGPQITLVQAMGVSPSLSSVRRRLLYRESNVSRPPEAVLGERPGIGFRLDQWGDVGAGLHQLASVSYAVPHQIDPRAFVASRDAPLQITVRAVP